MIRFGKAVPDKDTNEQVKVRMVSGDHIETCRYYATEAGIISREEASKDEVVMTGETFKRLVGNYSMSEDGTGDI